MRYLLLASSVLLAAVPGSGSRAATPETAAFAAQKVAPELRFDPAVIPDRARVLALLDHTARAQIAQLQGPIPLRPMGHINTNWISAAFLTGLTRLTRESDASDGTRFMRAVAEHYNFGLQGSYSPRAMIDADNLAIGELYLELHARSGEEGEIAPLRQRLDYNLERLIVAPAPPQLTWWWCDALFMAPPVLARMAVQSRDPAYLHAMDVQWWRTHERLWAASDGLYLRDERFATRTAKNGKRIFWSRGNGWAIGGIARVLESMPENFPSRPRYVETFRAMAKALVPLQRADGLWPTNLLDPEDPSGGETSGSAFFVYAMAWGINHGILDRETYQPAVLRGWSALAGAIQPDGLLGYVQRVGDQPVPSVAADKGLYATGALILAGLEVRKLGKPVTVLPLAEPARDPPGPLRLPITLSNNPRTTPEAEAGYRRAAAERQAMIDLAYDPARQPGAEIPAPAPSANGVVMPRMTVAMAPPAASERSARATVVVAPYRYGDLLWENDRTAHRIYGQPLEDHEPPSGSGIDAWGKNVAWPFMERQLKSGKEHDYHGEGIDFYNVGTSRGAGGLGIWHDNKLWASRNYRAVRILKNGPGVAEFEVDYAPWPVDVDRKVWETRRFSLPLGTHFTRIVSTINSDKPGLLSVAIGIGKRSAGTGSGTFAVDRVKGVITFFGPDDPDKGAMMLALLVDPAMIAAVTEDSDNYLVVLKVNAGKPLAYYMGSAWTKGAVINSKAAWEREIAAQKPNFAVSKP